MTTHMKLVTAAALAALSGASAAACSGKEIPAGGIFLAVDTNLKVPDDIDAIGISITSAEDGTPSEDAMFPLAPGGSARFPATLDVVRGTDKPLQIRAVGYKNGAAIAMREAVTTLPADHVALMNLELNWLDRPLVSGTTAEAVRSVTTSCSAGEGPVAGSCASFQLDSATLGGFEPTAVAPSDGAAAVDVDSCFGSAQTVSPDPATCSFAPPSGVTSAAEINVALVPAPGHSAGWCSGASCVVPLPNDPLEGWSLGSDGAIHLPPAVCASAAVKAILVVPASASCPVLSSSHPAKQVYGTDGGKGDGTRDGGDATAPADASSGDDGGDATTDAADAAEAGPPPPPYASSTVASVVSIASDGTTIYALVAPPVGAGALPMVVAELPLDFLDGTTPTRVTLPAAALVAPAATVASAAGNGLYVFSNVASASSFASLQVTSLDQPAVTTPFVAASDGGTFTDLDIADAGANSALVTFVEPGSAYGTTVGAAMYTKGQSSLAYVAPSAPGLLASGRYTPAGGGAPRYVFGGVDGGVFSAATYGGALTTERFLVGGLEPYAFAYASGALQALTVGGPVEFSSGYISVNPGKAVPNDFTGSANVVAWVSKESNDVAYAVYDGGVFTETAYPALLPDAGIPTQVFQVIFVGQELVWSDASGVHRTLASTLPH